MANENAMLAAARLGITDAYTELVMDESRTIAASDGYHRAHQAAHAHKLQKRAERDTVIRSAQQHGLGVPPAQMAALDAGIASAELETKCAYEVMGKHSRSAAGPTRELLREADVYLNSYPVESLRVAALPSFDGDAHAVLKDATAAIAAKRVEKREWRDRPAPLAEVLESALYELDRVCLTVLPTVGADGSLGWDSSARGLDIRGHDRVELVYDARAYYLADPANKKVVAEHIERTLRERYKTIPRTGTATEKAVAAAKLNAEILELQRLQAVAIRAIRGGGDWVAFPAGIDVRAVLGLDGPKPRSRD